MKTLVCLIYFSLVGALSPCGNIFTAEQFFLTSENYPSSYPPGKECFYLIRGVNCTTHFNIEFLDFDLIASAGCVKDRLEIGLQDALCGTRNGSKLYISENKSLKLKFVALNRSDGPEKRGFKLFISRVDDCRTGNFSLEQDSTVENQENPEDTTESVQFEWTTKPTSLSTPAPDYIPSPPQSQPCCQNNIFSAKTFLLTSPNFPYSINTPSYCTFVIKKSSPLVCRIRIEVMFFSLGPPSVNSCPYGHLEIDGKFICGCNSDIQLTTSFGEAEIKVLRFRSAGYNVNGASGFILEVNQDECQKSYSAGIEDMGKRDTGKFRYYIDQKNRIKWPENINQLRLINERLYHFQPGKEVKGHSEDVYKHFYFFAPEEEENDRSWTQTSQEKEETSSIEISSINTLLTDLYNYQQCIQWNSNQLSLLQKRFGNSLYQICGKAQENIDNNPNCVISTGLQGNFASPGYPFGYFANQNLCYRFKLLPGYCAVRIYFRDFQIEPSYDCVKDYLAINQYRYCGNYLANKQVTIGAVRGTHQDLKFVSDVNYCGKGFFAAYQQVRCQKPDEENWITPFNNCQPEKQGKNAHPENPIRCGRVIGDKYFVIRSSEETREATWCSYDITKYSENVCKIQLHFEQFNIPCEQGSLIVNGQNYCGERSGQSVTIDTERILTIVHRKIQYQLFIPNNFIIRGEQIEKCVPLIPDPARLVSKPIIEPNILKSNGITMTAYPDVCALINKRVAINDLPRRICEMLKKNHNVTECTYSKAIVSYPNETTANHTIVRLLNGDSAKANYRDIEC